MAAIALAPTRTVSSAGEKIEVNMGEPAEQPGVAEAPAKAEESKPQEIAKPQPKVEEAKPVVKATPVKTAPVAKAAPKKTQPKIVAAALPAKEKTDDSDDTQSKVEEQPAEKEILMPVKETPPPGVEAATSEDETEAKSEDVQKTEDPSPVAVATATPVETQTGDLAKGGASKEGAVSYLDLKQMPGNKAPNYPLQARKEKRQGQLELLYRVTKEGKVTDIQVAKSSGSKDLDSEAVRAIAQFKFVPGQEAWARHEVNFSLKGPVATLPSQLRGKGAQAD
jgi:protein TonB